MQIFMNGCGQRDFAPDQITASVTFKFHADTYDAALKGGVETVKNYIDNITKVTDMTADEFKTRAYSVREEFHINKLEPKTEADLGKNLQKRVSDGFFFTQYARFEFDYDKMRLAKLLVASSKISGAPLIHVEFGLKDVEAKKRELIGEAYEDAKRKAEALAAAAHKDLRDCVRVEIDPVAHRGEMDYGVRYEKAAAFGASMNDFEQEIKNIDETFKPDDITLSKSINCVWETSN